MTRYSRLVRVCNWLHPVRLLGVSIPCPPGQTGLSHSICEQCAITLTQKEQP